MKDDIKKINRQFLLTLVTFILIILLAIAGALVANWLIANDNIKYIIFFSILIIMIFVISIFRRNLTEITILSFLIKIRNHAGPPLEMQHTRRLETFGPMLYKQDFTRFAFDQAHTLYFRMHLDPIKKIFKRYVLDIVVLIHREKEPFYLDVVDAEIGKIQQDQLKQHKKIDRMFITQIKSISNLDDQTKESIKEIVFVKTRQTIISTINVGLHGASNKAVMLYSDSYSPSLYYTYHIDFIKSII